MRFMVHSCCKRVMVGFFIVAIPFHLSLSQNEGDVAKEKISKLTARVEAVDAAIEGLQQQLALALRDYQQFQRDIVYTNGLPAEIHKEIKAMEKVLVEKRQALEEATLQVPGAKEMLESRKRLYAERTKLMDSRYLLMNEINALKLRVGQAEAKK